MLFKKRKEIVWTYPLVCNYADKILNTKEYMSFLLQKNRINKGFHLYIHIPFCNSICSFCPFYKILYSRLSYDDKKVFYNALIRELIMYSKTNNISSLPVTSIYFGGGDGACVELEFAEKIINCIYENFNLSHCKEFSIEGCVSSLLEPTKLEFYKDKGVTRVSFGIQTFIKSLRKALTLKGSEEDIFELVDKINKTKFKNGFGVDIMINLPNQKISDLETDIKKIFIINPTQIDFYNLALFPDSAFYKEIMKSDEIKIKPSDDRFIRLYTIILDRFKEKKYNAVKAYSFSLDKKTTYAAGFDFLSDDSSFLGVGPSASSYFNGRGYKNYASLNKYIKSVNNNIFPVESGIIATAQIKNERLMVFFPVLLKINKNKIPDNFSFRGKVNALIDYGYVRLENNQLIVTDLGHIWTGNLQRYFFGNSQLKKEKVGQIKNTLDFTENFEIWFRQGNT